jgi:hypothetical protein
VLLTHRQVRDDSLLDPVPDAPILAGAPVLIQTGNGHPDLTRAHLTAQQLGQQLVDVNAPANTSGTVHASDVLGGVVLRA